MGASWAQHQQLPKPAWVLVPPMFERQDRERDRMAASPVAHLAARNALARLFTDYLSPAPGCLLLLAPPADTRLTVEALVAPRASHMALRYQPLGPAHPHTFVGMHARQGPGPGHATLRASVFDPVSGLGVFATAPLDRQPAALAQVGVRYSSPALTAGAILQPQAGRVRTLWLAGRFAEVVAGVEVSPPGAQVLGKGGVLDGFRSHSKLLLAYEPNFSMDSGEGRFTACVEVGQQALSISFLQHMAITRRVYNPTESKDCQGITNYVDIGMQITMPIGADASPAPEAQPAGPKAPAAGPASSAAASALSDGGQEEPGSVNVAAAWQVNKNWLVKARVGSSSAGAALVARTWQKFGCLAAVNATYRYGDAGGPKLGAWVQVENIGVNRYERGVSVASGRAVLQRHEASAQDVANAEGQGMLVMRAAPRSTYSPPEEAQQDFL